MVYQHETRLIRGRREWVLTIWQTLSGVSWNARLRKRVVDSKRFPLLSGYILGGNIDDAIVKAKADVDLIENPQLVS